MNDVVSVDPRTGLAVEVVTRESTADEVARLCATAQTVASEVDALGSRPR